MKVAIIGSRDICLDKPIDYYIPSDMTLLVSGGARGVDSIAEKYADEHNIEKLIFKPDYSTFGKRAPIIRNKDIINACDKVVAIWDGLSRGTKFTIDYAKSQGKRVDIFLVGSLFETM